MASPKDMHDAQQVMYGAAGVVTWLVWDTVIHLDVEIDSIWRRPRTWVKFLYFFIRYTPIIHTLALVIALGHNHRYSDATCKGWIFYELIYMEVLTLAVEIVLVMRLYALYNANQLVLWAIILAFAAEVAVMVVCLCIVLPGMTFTPACLVAHADGIFVAYWASSLAFETLLFLLTLVKFYHSVAHAFREQSILGVFLRDGTWAFALIFVAMLLNLLMYKLCTTPLAGMGYGWALAALAFSGAHILLNLQSLGAPHALADTCLPSDRSAPPHGCARGCGAEDSGETAAERFTTVLQAVDVAYEMRETV
ncbi:hypothetical protein PsYK624_142330 [Phanerochaete sordida]|uniref:DUF6533 domain-containing protein n=1 Tax=Phanerochaete sordida TaxID=48140 RepID=A0A9P3GNK6_9APHY|nr:hypothetical protein PsYK624_142330 [Phanerochaete sordida]